MSITVVATPSVRAQQLKLVIAERGLEWDHVAHVSATTTLAEAVLKSGSFACSIAPLVQLVIDALDDDLPNHTFPGAVRFAELGGTGAAFSTYRKELKVWMRAERARRLGDALRFDDGLRSLVRSDPSNGVTGSVLVRGRRRFEKSVQLLVASGFVPDDVQPGTGTEHTAVRAWRTLESNLPRVSAARRTLWERSPATATDVLKHTLASVFGAGPDRVTLAYHGFYFFTPQQWRFFRLVEESDAADQIFLMHSDGRLPVFDIWSKYFEGRWELPPPVGTTVPGHGVSAAASAFARALEGRRVDAGPIADSLAVKECRSAAELVRLWRDTEPSGAQEQAVSKFAAQSDEVVRFVQRLWGSGATEDVDLAQLPVGSFLLAVHSALHVDDFGRVSIRLATEQVATVVRSGFLAEASDLPPWRFIGAVDRALPFFRKCRSARDWRHRADELVQMISDVRRLQRRVPGSDLDRMTAASSGLVMVVPWLDLDDSEAHSVRAAVSALTDLLERLVIHERVSWKDHWAVLADRLALGMKTVSAEERQIIDEKMSQVSIGLDGEIHIDGIVDAVAIVLGRSVDFDTGDDMGDVESATVSEPRAMDALGYSGADGAFHLANISDGAFPASISGIGWPFRAESVVGGPAESREILESRRHAGTLSSLYLFWLALDAASVDTPLTLSWISDVRGERRAPSPFISLLTQPPDVDPDVDPELADALGGIRVDPVSPPDDVIAEAEPLTPLRSRAGEEVVDAAMEVIPRRAAASALACPRRFALQWALGESAAFSEEYQWIMAYGNVVGALVREHGVVEADARALADRIWSAFTDGELASSLAKRVVKPTPRSAHPTWVLTLGGSQGGSSGIDNAYRAAKNNSAPDRRAIVPDEVAVLPPGVSTPDACKHCPVRTRCLNVMVE